MDLIRHLRTFVTVSEQGSVSKAALVLRITQPALSRQVRELEEDLGLPLFQRLGGRLVLTGEGEQLLGDCRDLLSHAGSLREHAQSLCTGNGGVLKVAAGCRTIERVFPTFLRHYAVLHPGVQMKVIEAGAAERLIMLERGEVHFSISIVPTNDDRFESYTLRPLGVLAAYNPSLRIGHTDIIEISRLSPLPLLLLKSNWATRRIFDAACRLARLQPNIFIEGEAPALLALAEAGHGVAIVASGNRVSSKKLRFASVAYRREPLQMMQAVLWDKRRPLPRYAEGFPKSFAAHMEKVFPLSGPSGRAAPPHRAASQWQQAAIESASYPRSSPRKPGPRAAG